MYKRGHFIVDIVLYTCIDLFRLTWSDITVLMLMSMSLYLAPLFPSYLCFISLPRDLFGAIIAVYKVHEHASISIDSLCNYSTPARL